MSRALRVAILLACLAALRLPALDAQQARRAVAATKQIQDPNGEDGKTTSVLAGVCIDADQRLVVTSTSAIGSEADEATVVLASDTGKPQPVPARVLRKDEKLGLALLQLPAATAPLAALELGNPDGLVAGTEVAVFGYVPGARQGVPATIRAEVGKVTFLDRDEDGRVVRLELTAESAHGKPGEPVLDNGSGRLVAVVTGNGDREDVRVAVATTRIRQFLGRTEFSVSVPAALDQPDRCGELALVVSALGYGPTRNKRTCRVILGDEPNTYPAEVRELVANRTWQATAPLLPPSRPFGRLAARIDTGESILHLHIQDQLVTVGGTDHYLSDFTQIGPDARLLYRTGQKGAGKVTSREPITGSVGDREISLPFASIRSLRVIAPQLPTAPIPYRVEVWEGETQVLATTGRLPVGDVARQLLGLQGLGNMPENADPFVMNPPPAAGGADEDSTLQLPAKFSRCTRAGNGRYLLLTMPEAGKLAVVDIAQRAIAGYVKLPATDTLVAGGRHLFVMAMPKMNLIETWSLADRTRIRRSTIPVPGDVKGICMGAGSNGPLLIGSYTGASPDTSFVDPVYMTPLGLEGENICHLDNAPYFGSGLWASDSGTVFSFWRTQESNTGRLLPKVYVCQVGNGTAPWQGKREWHTRTALPGPRGDYVFTMELGMVRTGQIATAEPRRGEFFSAFPSSHPAYYFAFVPEVPETRGKQSEDDKIPYQISIYAKGNPAPIHTPPAYEELWWPVQRDFSYWGFARTFSQRYHLVPQLGVLAVLNREKPQIVFHPLDIEKLVRAQEPGILVVDSVPPRKAQRGTTFRYQLHALSPTPQISYRLDSGPPGMSISPDGEITWPIPFAQETARTIIVCVSAATGQRVLHTFSLELTE